MGKEELTFTLSIISQVKYLYFISYCNQTTSTRAWSISKPWQGEIWYICYLISRNRSIKRFYLHNSSLNLLLCFLVTSLIRDLQNLSEWEKALIHTLGEHEYVLVCSSIVGLYDLVYELRFTNFTFQLCCHQLFGLALVVFCRASLYPFISNVQTATVSCGIFSVVPNKGAIAMSMFVSGTPICFISVHFTSGRGLLFINLI